MADICNKDKNGKTLKPGDKVIAIMADDDYHGVVDVLEQFWIEVDLSEGRRVNVDSDHILKIE